MTVSLVSHSSFISVDSRSHHDTVKTSSNLSCSSSCSSSYGFYHLPTDVMHMVMSSWLDTEDLVRLDSSTMNHEDRQAFLAVVQTRHFHTPGLLSGSATMTMEYFQWLVLRNIRIRSLSLGRGSGGTMSTTASSGVASAVATRGSLTFSSLLQLRHFVREIEHLHIDFSSAAGGRHLSECALHILRQSVLRVQSLTIARSTACDRDLLALIDTCAPPTITTAKDGQLSCFPSLTSLDLTALNGSRVSESVIVRLLACCPALETLSLAAYSGMNMNRLLEAVAKYCPYVRCLSLDDCLSLSDEGFQSLARNDISSPDVVADNANGNAAAVGGLCLEKLSLNRCERVTVEGLLPILQRVKNSLVSLSVAGCTALDMDRVMEGLIQYNHESITVLDMSYSTSVSQPMLITMMKECLKLKRVSANFCTSVTRSAGSEGKALNEVVKEKRIDLQTIHLPK